MTNWDENEDHSVEGHLSEGRLLLYLDGELSPGEAEKVQRHLTACWSCRMNTDRVQEVVFLFVKYRDEALRLLMPPSDEQGFTRRLEQLREQLGNRSWLAHLYDWRRRLFSAMPLTSLPRPLILAAMGLAVSFTLVALFTRSDRIPVVTASELLQRAGGAQAQALRATAQPVVYQKLRIRRGKQVATWELWRDTTNARFRQAVKSATESPQPGANEAALLSELAEVLRANHMDPQQPLSAASFQRWRQSLAAKREEVSRSQTEAVRL